MRVLIILSCVAFALGFSRCPPGLPRDNCDCIYTPPGGDENIGETVLTCGGLNQSIFEQLTANLSGYSFDEIVLIQNTFTKLHKSAFKNVTIGLLVIESTPINDVDQEAFADIIHLREINIADTNIRRIPHFRHIAHSLTELILESNNINTLEKDEFSDLVNLKVLILDNNNITTIEDGVFHSLTNLREVSLNLNDIHEVGNWFDTHSNMSELSLSDNNIVSLPASLLKRMPNLENLLINDNDFEGLPENVFGDFVRRELSYLDAENNRLVCDERLCWLYHYLESIEDLKVAARCEEPGSLSGLYLDEIEDSIDVNCKNH